jgi:aminoglycoside 6'-N-acetyltransferase
MFRLGQRRASNRGERQDRIPLTLHGEHVTLRPMEDADIPQLHEILKLDDVRAWWGEYASVDEVYEDFLERDDATLAFIIEHDGYIIGGLQLWQELNDEYRHAGFDIFLDSSAQGHGVGVEAIQLATRYAFDVLGHHRVTIDPAAANVRGIRAYEKAGFRTIGLMRNYERSLDGSWHDNVLMEIIRNDYYNTRNAQASAGVIDISETSASV